MGDTVYGDPHRPLWASRFAQLGMQRARGRGETATPSQRWAGHEGSAVTAPKVLLLRGRGSRLSTSARSSGVSEMEPIFGLRDGVQRS